MFLIHISVKPDAAAAIGDYIAVRGKMNVCPMHPDAGAVGASEGDMNKQGDRYLQDGIAQATHVLGLIAPEIPRPWWLECIGEMGRASGVEPVLLTLKGMTDDKVSYHSFEMLRGIKSLNEYIFRVSPEVDHIIFNNPEYGGLMAHTAPNHPLDAFLDWEH